MNAESKMLGLLGRTTPLFASDISQLDLDLVSIVESGRFLVIGGAGSIGQAFTK